MNAPHRPPPALRRANPTNAINNQSNATPTQASTNRPTTLSPVQATREAPSLSRSNAEDGEGSAPTLIQKLEFRILKLERMRIEQGEALTWYGERIERLERALTWLSEGNKGMAQQVMREGAEERR